MPLPEAPQRTGTVTVAGTEVPIRSLTRAEALELRHIAEEADGDADRLGEVLLIAKGTGVSAEEAEVWWDMSDASDVQALVAGIARLSRLGDWDGKDPNSRPSAPSSRGRSTRRTS
jgi:hypothetical protein